MAGDQLAIWNQVNSRSNEPIPSTHLTIFVPPALGAFILANLKSPKGDPPQLRPVTPSQPHSSSVLTASRPFHLDLPLVFPDNEDIIMDNARQAAAAGFIRPESIPLLAITDESFYHGKLSWTLRFPVPPPVTSGSARRFSSTLTFQQGPHSAEALDGALRLAAPFSYNNDASHVLFNSPFLRLPDLSILRPPRIESYETPSPPEPAVQDWLNNRAPRLIPHRHREYIPVPLGLVDFFNSNIHLPQVAMLIATNQCHNEEATAEARKHKREFAALAFLRVPLAHTVTSGRQPPDPPSFSPTPETRPSQPSATAPQPVPSSHSVATRSQHPPIGPCSDPKRPRIPSQGSAPLGSHPGYRPQFPDNTRPVGSSASSSARSSRGPYAKGKDATTGMAYTVQGKGADKGTFKGTDSFPPDWPPLTPGPPKGSSKHSSGVTSTGSAKGPTKGKSNGFHFATIIASITPPWPAWAYCPARCRALWSTSPGFMLSRLLYWHLFASSLLSPELLWPAWAYCPARRLTFSSPSPFFSFRLPLLFFASPASSPSLPFPSSSPSFSFLSRCLPKVASPKVAAPFYRPSPKWPFVAMSGASRLVPPMLRSYPGALYLCAAYAAGANYADACRGPPAQRLLAFSSLLQGASLLPLRPSWFLGTISITCSHLSSYVVLYETLRTLTYIVLSLPPFFLDDVGSVGSACGILSGPSSWTRHSL